VYPQIAGTVRSTSLNSVFPEVTALAAPADASPQPGWCYQPEWLMDDEDDQLMETATL
jgi:hypothetical protein